MLDDRVPSFREDFREPEFLIVTDPGFNRRTFRDEGKNRPYGFIPGPAYDAWKPFAVRALITVAPTVR